MQARLLAWPEITLHKFPPNTRLTVIGIYFLEYGGKVRRVRLGGEGLVDVGLDLGIVGGAGLGEKRGILAGSENVVGGEGDGFDL